MIRQGGGRRAFSLDVACVALYREAGIWVWAVSYPVIRRAAAEALIALTAPSGGGHLLVAEVHRFPRGVNRRGRGWWLYYRGASCVLRGGVRSGAVHMRLVLTVAVVKGLQMAHIGMILRGRGRAVQKHVLEFAGHSLVQ